MVQAEPTPELPKVNPVTIPGHSNALGIPQELDSIPQGGPGPRSRPLRRGVVVAWQVLLEVGW